MKDGTEIRVPVSLVNGADPGKTLYLQAVSDGDELNGLSVIRQVLRRLDPGRLSGRIIAVLIANVHAFHAEQNIFCRRLFFEHIDRRPADDSLFQGLR